MAATQSTTAQQRKNTRSRTARRGGSRTARTTRKTGARSRTSGNARGRTAGTARGRTAGTARGRTSGRQAQGARRSRPSASAYGAEGFYEARTAKVIEIVASSGRSFDDAIRNGLEDARETLHNIHGCDVKNFTVKCEDGKPVEYRVDLKIAFGIDR